MIDAKYYGRQLRQKNKKRTAFCHGRYLSIRVENRARDIHRAAATTELYTIVHQSVFSFFSCTCIVL